jgi:hypothetical protein
MKISLKEIKGRLGLNRLPAWGRSLLRRATERHRSEALTWVRHAVPFVTSILVTCLYVAGMHLPVIMTSHRATVLVLLATATGLLATAAVWVMRGSWRGFLSLTLFVIGGFGYMLTVTSDMSRYGLTLLIAAMCFYHLDRLGSGNETGRLEGRESLTMITLAPAAFFSYTYAFAVLEYTSTSVLWMAVLVGLMSAAVVGEMVWHVQRAGRYAWQLPAVALLLGAEMFVMMSFLPLKHLANGATLAILLSVFAHKVRTTLAPSADQFAFRRHAALSILLIAVILATAQWL